MHQCAYAAWSCWGAALDCTSGTISLACLRNKIIVSCLHDADVLKSGNQVQTSSLAAVGRSVYAIPFCATGCSCCSEGCSRGLLQGITVLWTVLLFSQMRTFVTAGERRSSRVCCHEKLPAPFLCAAPCRTERCHAFPTNRSPLAITYYRIAHRSCVPLQARWRNGIYRRPTAEPPRCTRST